MNKLEWRGFVADGKIEFVDEDGYNQALKQLSGDVRITIEPWRNTRSNQQNRYYFGVVVKAVKEALAERGHKFTANEVHEAMKQKFLMTFTEGEELPRIRSTTDLSTTEFEDLCENVRRWAAEFLHVNIPEPHQVDFIDETP